MDYLVSFFESNMKERVKTQQIRQEMRESLAISLYDKNDVHIGELMCSSIP